MGVSWLASLAAAAFAFVEGPIRGHGAIVPASFLAVFGMAALGFASLLGGLAARAGEGLARVGYRVASLLSALGAAAWIVWFFAVIR